jgi:hypothetical protein
MKDPLLTPPQPAGKVAKGRPPHGRYRLIRSKFEEIAKARDVLRLSDRLAAKRVGLRGAREYAEAYDLLKKHGASIMAQNDWEGVEAVIYARFPRYRNDKKFHEIQAEYNDPRPRLGLADAGMEPPRQGGGEKPSGATPDAPATPLVRPQASTPQRSPWGGKDPGSRAFPKT